MLFATLEPTELPFVCPQVCPVVCAELSENESVCDSDELTLRLSPQFSEELMPFAVICDVPEESVLLEE